MSLPILQDQIKKYIPNNEQEEADKRIMLKYLEEFPNILTRENEFAHFTASAWAINPEKTKVLMIYHNIYQSWAWTGGHADGESNLLETAIRELKEETGIQEVKVLQENIFSLEALTVDGHMKRGKYVPSHIHLNLTYLMEVDEQELLEIKEDENSGVKWVPMEEVEKISNEDWIKKNIYHKLNEKLKNVR